MPRTKKITKDQITTKNPQNFIQAYVLILSYKMTLALLSQGSLKNKWINTCKGLLDGLAENRELT